MTSCCCWAPQSSITCWAWCLSFFSHPLMFIVVTSHVLLFSNSLHPISWLVFLLSIESFVEMMSPRFHSAAFLVHLSGFVVAIRRACRHFSFRCVSTQLVMLYVSICSSASSVFLFPCSIQSSRWSSWLALLSPSSWNEILLSCHHVCCLLPESPRLFHRHECLFFLGGSGMKDVSAWQMLRRWDGLNELSSGKNEGVKTLEKKNRKQRK